MRKRLRMMSLLLGIACIAIAGYLFVDIQKEEQVAQTVSQDVVSAFGEKIKTEKLENVSLGGLTVTPDDEQVEVEEPSVESDEQAQDVPAVVIDGEQYIALLSIPALNLELPIAQNCNDANLKRTPCAYSGSFAKGNLVVAGHNYTAHFGGLHRLELGSTAVIMDAVGEVYQYTLAKIERVDGDDAMSVVSGDWDMSLLTCVYGDNTQRDVLRYQLVEQE